MSREMTIHDAALAVVRRLRQHGHQAFWAGGCVRDTLLGLKPSDIDVATDAHPDRIVDIFTRTRKVGMQFGVVLVRQGHHWIETATFRTDLEYRDGRRPEGVVFTNAEHDAQRRDFTINGLFYDPIEKQVIDYVDGQSDLRAGLIRAIGDPARRFAEDHLRLLRAVRFATRFGFRIDGATAAAIRDNAPNLARISAERIREELDKMFSRPTRAESVRLIGELGLLPHLWTGSSLTDGQLQQAVSLLAALPPDADFVMSLAALLHDFSPEETTRIGRALRCSNLQIEQTAWLVSSVTRLQNAADMPLCTFKRLLAQPRFDDLLAFHKAYCAAGNLPLDAQLAAIARRKEIPVDEIAPAPLVTGDDLIAIGIQPGPRYKKILDHLYDAQLNNELTGRQEALRRLHELAAAPKPTP